MNDERYPHVFRSISLGPVKIDNRFYFSPHGVPLHLNRIPTDDAVAYYTERAAGGCGLTMHSLQAFPASGHLASPFWESSIPAFAAMADGVHEHGAKMFGQLHYFWGATGSWQPLSPPVPTFAPSAKQHFEAPRTTRELSVKEIKRHIDSYRQSARNLRQAGYDGIEVHSSHGVMIEQFLSPYFNQRRDEYGGTPENRMRFLAEVLEAVQEGAGPELAVGLRLNCDELLPGGLTADDCREILSQVVAGGLIDFVDLDIAVEPNQLPLGMPMYLMEPGLYESFVATMREAAGSVPILSVIGRLTSIAEAERVIASGVADMVGAARGLIAEPELVKHAREGREAESRQCIACNWCISARVFGGFGCMINPASARERHWGVNSLEPAPERRRVVIVGGGPGGLEAARVSALRGHDVVLLERRDELGGQMELWSRLPGRDVFKTTPQWYERELVRLGVEVRKGMHATADMVLGQHPDAVVVATGSRYVADGESGFIAGAIPGTGRDWVYTPEQILEDGVRPTGNVVILDDEGINTGSGIAQLLASGDARVELVTRWLQQVSDSLIYSFEFALIIPLLKNAGVTVSTQTYIKEIGDHELTLFDVFTNEERRVGNVDAVVLATMRRANDRLARELDGRVSQLFVIGDALAPRPLAAATDEGQRFARMIGVPGAPEDFTDAFFRGTPADLYPSIAGDRRQLAQDAAVS